MVRMNSISKQSNEYNIGREDEQVNSSKGVRSNRMIGAEVLNVDNFIHRGVNNFYPQAC